VNQRSVRTTAFFVALGIAACVLLLGTMAGYLYLNAARMTENRNQSIHTANVMSTARALLAALDEAESGQRGYLLTGDQSYLAPYIQSLAATPGLLTQLRELTADDPLQGRRVAELQNAIAQNLNEMKEAITIFEASGAEAGRDFVKANAGRDIMSDIRRAIDGILGTEDAAFAERINRVGVAERNNELIVLFTVGGTLLVLAISAGMLFSAFRQSDRSQSVLQATINGITRGIAAFEKDRLVAWNDRFVALFGVPADLAKIGTPMSRFAAAGFDGVLSDLHIQMERARQKNETIAIERTRPDGTVFAMFFSPPRDGIATFGAADVTLDRQRDHFLRHAQKMDALGKMTGGIAHDFNNLLTVVLMNLDVLHDDPSIMQKFGRRIELMSAATQKGATLVQQLLAYARKQPLEPEVVDLRDLMPGLIDLIKRTIGEDIEVEGSIGKEICPTIVDPAQFESSVLNLALNARDAMPDGGRLHLELAKVALDETYTAIHAEVEPGDYVLLTVTDTGCGMAPEIAARAFDPFFTTKGNGQGTGLGLSMVYGFVKQTGGHIDLTSEPGKGTTFKLYFPVCRDAIVESDQAPRSPPPKGTENILIVEDDDRLRTTAAGALRDLGYETLQAANSQSALAVLESGAPVDLLFTDMILSGPFNGRKLAAAARGLRPQIKVLYTSGYIDKAERQYDEIDNASGLLNKPYQIGDLAKKLRSLLVDPVS
jgi:signal transduction histidine kinase/CHASE3 domain sensor protein